jgi:uncharacterized protein (UPF0332 family)
LTLPPLARDLRLKAERALPTARELQERDPDGSVNRSYYAMFDIARAALLSAGVREDELPRTHSGLIGSFSKHAVLAGRIEQKLFAALGRTESLRLIADYTGTPLAPKTAAETVARAEAFVGAVEKAFALTESSITNNPENDRHNLHDKISEPDVAVGQSETDYARLKPVSLEEIRCQARADWLQFRQQKIGIEKEAGHSKDARRDAKEDHGHSIDDDFDE